ncbi:zinc finger protein [Angomonas deanei]|uniref:FYVE zinc finger containing protein, putative n=1 Tax=Angomonas deanei TaxID=59799 RepID=A0A7G2CES5_9TRYP|nr:zinc finger protein [Angomonas deanei]CAD2216682.1 FYVE zinc finger containing protein, putative [Angomonas deanei]|eukprot:EPY37576.1 zinc finger protein [Angomonas deanei]
MGNDGSKDYWQKDEEAACCNSCHKPFTLTFRRHHCRNCGYVFCSDCCNAFSAIPMRGLANNVRVCNTCFGVLRASLRGQSAPAVAVTEAERAQRATSAPQIGNHPSEEGAASGNSPSQERAETGNEQYVTSYNHDGFDDTNAINDSQTNQTENENSEKERLQRKWIAVREEACFVDVIVQRAEGVGVDSLVEYSRETEALTLQPEVPPAVLSKTLLPFPAPAENSVASLLEPLEDAFPALLDEAQDLMRQMKNDLPHMFSGPVETQVPQRDAVFSEC